MTSDERSMAKPDERVTTADAARETENRPVRHEATDRQTEREADLRDRHEETIVNQDAVRPSEGAAASSGATAVREEPIATRDQSRQIHHERQPRAALFDEAETRRLQDRWTDIQGGFVDEPRRAVKEADTLVVDVTKRLADMFSGERTELERQWDRGDKASTEDLRVALQRYHAFFDRLLSV